MEETTTMFNSTSDNNSLFAVSTMDNDDSFTTPTTATTPVKVGRPPLVSMLQLLSGIIIILVNSATMAAFLVAKEVRKKGNVLVASLALTDILVGLALCVESATWHPELFVLYRTDKASCLARSTWFHVCIISSMVHILAIAADRYLYIVWPFVHMRLATVKTYAVLIAALWVMAAVLGVVPVFVNQFHEYGVCDLAKFQPRGYVAIFAPAFYFICLLGASVLYLLVANLAWKKLRSVGPVGVAGDAEGRINLGRKLKAMRQSIVVFLGFFFSMSPHFIVYIVNDVTPVSHEARLMLGLPAYLNSGVNFFVYMALNREFRVTIIRWLRKICCCRDNRVEHNDSTAAGSLP